MTLINREGCITKFEALLERASDKWILVFYGLSGIGKTTLLKHLYTLIDPKIATVWIDFDIKSKRDYYEEILDDMALALRSHHLPQVAWEIYENKRKEIYASLDLSRMNIKQKMVATAGATISNSPQTIIVEMDKALARLEKKAALEHIQALLELIQHLDEQFIIFIDHWDTLVEHGTKDYQEWLIQDVLLEGHQRLANTRVSMRVIVGSDRPLDETDFNKGIINFELVPLSHEQCQQLMIQLGMEDPKIQDDICNRTGGNPLLISLAVTLWREANAIDLTDLEEDLSVRAASQWLLRRIIMRLSDERTRDILTRGVMLQRWKRDTLEAVFGRQDLDFAWYDNFIKYPFVQDVPTYRGWKTFIRIIREIQIDQIWRERRPWFYETHKAALNWFKADNR